MKFRILLSTIFLLSVSLSLSATPVIDSIGVKNQDGKKVVLFKIKAKDTYYSIGRRYNVKPAVIMKFNDSKKETLTIGATIKVPTDQPYKKSGKVKETSENAVIKTRKEKKAELAKEVKIANEEKKSKQKSSGSKAPSVTETQEAAPERITVQQPVQVTQPVQSEKQPVHENDAPTTQYKVSAGETLYAISKRFNTTVDDITKLNNLSSTMLTPGQVLLVRSGSETPPPTSVIHNYQQVAKRDSTYVAPIKDTSNANHASTSRFGLYEKNEKGVATWIDDTSLDPNKKLVLHRTAPIGTVIKITNPMTNRTTFAKVVGRFTDNESTKDVVIVMTKNVADSLGALDKRFHVMISYGSPNE